jgi:hypothetical protein
MADQPNNQGAPGAIPPKAVPPTFRNPSTPAPGEEASSTAPRTVRLKPVVMPPGATPPVPAAASGGSMDAAETIKRMTARIAVLSGDGEPAATSKKRTGQVPIVGVDASVKNATSGLAGVISDASPTVKRMTSRIQMPSQTGLIPEVAADNGPRTIKVKPVAQGGGQPTGPVEAVAPAVGRGTVKLGTSRIPLESAMEVPPTESPASAAAGAIPKTIKLKRPGEMATVRVSVMGAKGAPEAAPAPSVADTAADTAAETSKKTIRVKRPNMPAAAGGVSEGADEDGAAASTAPVCFSPVVAPERGTGWFIALAAVGMIVIIGLGCLLAVQLYGGRPHTELDTSYQTN